MPVQLLLAYRGKSKTHLGNRKASITKQIAVILTLRNAAAKKAGVLVKAHRYCSKAAMLVGAFLVFIVTGCHSAYINAKVSNRTPTPISLVQVEYPSASFGTQTIAPGTDFHYRFKILGSGPMKITYTDSAQHEQKSTGPTLHEGTEGSLVIDVGPDGVHWQTPSSAK